MTRGVSLSRSVLQADDDCNSRAKLSIVDLHCVMLTAQVASSVWVMRRYDFCASKKPLEVYFALALFSHSPENETTHLQHERERPAFSKCIIRTKSVQEIGASGCEVIRESCVQGFGYGEVAVANSRVGIDFPLR